MNFLPKLESFEGPLDLLMHLIEKNKIDIYDIPIAEITDQYMEFLADADETDPEFLSEFLVMAATLLEIKAKMLLPAEEDEAPEEDPRAGLVERLLEYKLFRYMSSLLKDRELDASKTVYRPSSGADSPAAADVSVDYGLLLNGVTLKKLTELFKEAMARSAMAGDDETKRFGRIRKESVTIPARMDEIRILISKRKSCSFRVLIESRPTKEYIIVTFLAVLELIKDGEIYACQADDDIILSSSELLWKKTN